MRSRRHVRLFLAVFLVVFLSGLGVSGAWALWSQSATTVATVKTDTWVDYTRPGFSLPLTVEAHTSGGSGGWDLVAQWSRDIQDGARVTYRGSLEYIRPGGGPGSSTSINGSGQSATVSTNAPPGGSQSDYKLTLTPIVNRVEGKTIEKRLTIQNNGTVRVTDWR